MTANLLSIGMPMLLMGDELLRTQHGNNNAYCQDNEISWMQWETGPRGHDMFRFVRELLKYRRYLFSREREDGSMLSLAEMLRRADICWHGVHSYSPDWGAKSHALAFSAISLDVDMAIYIIFNAYWDELSFILPLPPHDIEGCWHRVLDTSLPSPHDIIPMGELLPEIGTSYLAKARSASLFACGNFAGIEHHFL